jgi:hypothetical protein
LRQLTLRAAKAGRATHNDFTGWRRCSRTSDGRRCRGRADGAVYELAGRLAKGW